ncbi:tetratricopeptide repeat protein [Tuwongella immobilis]|uniref:Tetratricopeptide tpr_1 repeat-containing protein n=1 Tax=Tuwongella immobilis TaxID=692036 RepID=A0A6C2YPT8_9BACT|nr:tetratricopeptide repeat protein [Tuwongella immobilis]VIP03143.1 tetratricopeptide tpr_1 repeat-containing protein : [Tuwongella immobilis]VTS03516.1 tetratricopeptide tpr_1 repeat-containing protein : [Tuwongella immobilis]
MGLLGDFLSTARVTGPRQRLLKFNLRAEPAGRDRPVIQVTGRAPGFWSALLSIFGLATENTLTVTANEVIRESRSKGGNSITVIPMRQVASVLKLTQSSSLLLLLGALGVLGMATLMFLLSFALGKQGEALLSIAGSMSIPGALMLVSFFTFKPRMALLITSTGSHSLGICLEPSNVKGESITLDRLDEMVEVIHDLIRAANSASAAPIPAESRATGRRAEPEAEPMEPEFVEDFEESAANLFRQGAALYKQGRHEEAVEIWRRVASDYPETSAGQAAARNLRKL